MTYFEHLPKKKLRELQLQSALKRKENYLVKYRIALLLWEQFEDVHKVAKYFGVTRDAAYKMIKRGKELKREV